ncbi:MAG: hypothetical protein GX281_02085 [Bacteroidales bacterium]|nr:hypothetical protein [Bacteroidales bacterium]
MNVSLPSRTGNASGCRATGFESRGIPLFWMEKDTLMSMRRSGWIFWSIVYHDSG